KEERTLLRNEPTDPDDEEVGLLHPKLRPCAPANFIGGRAVDWRRAVEDSVGRCTALEKARQLGAPRLLHSDDRSSIFRKRPTGDPVADSGELCPQVPGGLRQVYR